MYSEFVTRSKSYTIEHLYIAVNEKGQAKDAIKLVSVPKQLMVVLVETYCRNAPSRSSASASNIVPNSCLDNSGAHFCLIRNPNFAPTIDAEDEEDSSAYCYLVQFTSEALPSDEPTNSSPPKSKNQWDNKILWNFCRWRSCLAPATSSPSPRSLCTHHSMLKQFLESNKRNEAARFLPRKPPNLTQDEEDATINDLKLIKAASSLVEELADNKLASTIDSFCHRISSEHGLLRHKYWSRFNPTQQSAQLTEPTWKRWSSPGILERTLHDIDINHTAASTCFNFEHAATAEIQCLTSAYAHCPEVSMIQKELKNELYNDLLNINSTQRKFELISALVHHSMGS
jgi:hypothetical protein